MVACGFNRRHRRRLGGSSANNATISTTEFAGPPGKQQLGPKSVPVAAAPSLEGSEELGLKHRHQRRNMASAAVLATGEYPMIRAKLTGLATMAFVAAGASAQAQTQTASAEPTIWDHNGSVMYLVANGQSREFHYQKPRAGMLDVGARPGSLLVRGEIDNGQYSGTAYIFSPHCGQIPFQVKGPIGDNDERIILTGQAPRLGRDCRANESHMSNLEFRRLKSNDGAQSQDQSTAVTAPRLEESKREVPSTAGAELASAPTAQPPAASQGASVYVAGKGKYCRETGVGYLDCFYASLDACQKHNKPVNARCVPNPNSGT